MVTKTQPPGETGGVVGVLTARGGSIVGLGGVVGPSMGVSVACKVVAVGREGADVAVGGAVLVGGGVGAPAPQLARNSIANMSAHIRNTRIDATPFT